MNSGSNRQKKAIPYPKNALKSFSYLDYVNTKWGFGGRIDQKTGCHLSFDKRNE